MDFFSEYQTNTLDLALSFYGFEDCPSGYSFGPAIRDTYVLHYISKGRGKFHYQGEIIELRAGDFFLLQPNELTFYQADDTDPWSYYWLGITGAKAPDYFSGCRIARLSYLQASESLDTGQIGRHISQLVHFAKQQQMSQTAQLYTMSQLYQLLYQLSSLAPQDSGPHLSASRQLYLNCKQILDTQYPTANLSVQAVAQQLNVHRSYLSILFKRFQQQAPKEYLHQVRMMRAKQLLTSTSEPIKIIAASVGFTDPLYFSKAFKLYFGQTPSQTRKHS